MSISVASLIQSATIRDRPLNICSLGFSPEMNVFLSGFNHNLFTNSCPISVSMDLIISPHMEGKLKAATKHSYEWQCPVACIYEELPDPSWLRKKFEFVASYGGHVNFYPNDVSLKSWGRTENAKHRIIHDLEEQLNDVEFVYG